MHLKKEEFLPIEPIRGSFRFSFSPPGSKSITNRAFLLASLARGVSEIYRPLEAEDTMAMEGALKSLGVQIGRCGEGHDRRIEGGEDRLPCGGAVDARNSGTTARFISAAAALCPAPVVVDGGEQMRRRPMLELSQMLESLGASVDWLGAVGHLPMRIHPRLHAGVAEVRVRETVSSQFVSAILMIGACLPGGLRLLWDKEGELTSSSYVTMTLSVMEQFGAIVETAGPGDIRIGSGGYIGRSFAVEPDASSATYFLAAAAVTPGAVCTIEGLGKRSVQGDVGFADVLGEMGAGVVFGTDFVSVIGPSEGLRGVDRDLCLMPDAAMTLAATALLARGETVIRGLRTLRHKESDRLSGLARELTKFGAEVDVEDESVLVIRPRALPKRSGDRMVIETYDDHRMAMAFAIPGLHESGVVIRNPACVNKTYPGFWDDLKLCVASDGKAYLPDTTPG